MVGLRPLSSFFHSSHNRGHSDSEKTTMARKRRVRVESGNDLQQKTKRNTKRQLKLGSSAKPMGQQPARKTAREQKIKIPSETTRKQPSRGIITKAKPPPTPPAFCSLEIPKQFE